MALQLNDSATSKKAPTGPNPQNRLGGNASSNAASGSATTRTQPAGGNPAVNTPAPQAAPPPAQAPPAAQGPTYDYTTDPILQLVNAQSNLAIQQAQASALAQQKAALIAYGDAGLAMSVLGDQNTALAAQNNPTSTLAQLAFQNKTNVRNINETENKQNLFYSTDAAYQLGLNQQTYLANRANAANDVQGKLGTIGTQLLAAEQAAYEQEIQAQQDAYNRAIQSPTLGYSGISGSIDTTPSAPAPAQSAPASSAPPPGAWTNVPAAAIGKVTNVGINNANVEQHRSTIQGATPR